MAVSRLVIVCGTTEAWDITGDPHRMQEAYQRIKERLESQDIAGAEDRFVEVVGFSNRPGNMPETILVKVEAITALSLQEPG